MAWISTKLSSMVVLLFALFIALASAGQGDAMPLVLADASLSLEDGMGEAEMLVDSEGWQVVPEEVAKVWQVGQVGQASSRRG